MGEPESLIAAVTPPVHGRGDRYLCYAELASCEREGLDFRVVVREVAGAATTIIAPHAGAIERGTSRLAMAIAGDEHSYYLFEGLKPRRNFTLHITSRRFDEPRCLALVGRSRTVVSLHGCAGEQPAIYLGGRAAGLKGAITAALRQSGCPAVGDDHHFPALDADNICNRGADGAGVQIEFTAGFRRTMDVDAIAAVIRATLT